MPSLNRVLAAVAAEHGVATGKFPPINSGHEGKAVIEEELDELWLEVKANRGTSREAMQEAIQIAAMAVRYVCDLGDTL
jgi:hypothetical protein